MSTLPTEIANPRRAVEVLAHLDAPSVESGQSPVVLKKLQAWHKEAMSLIAQGVPRQDVAKICDCTPEYITWLVKQDVCKDYVRGISEVVDAKLEMLYEQSVEAIGSALREGSVEDRLKAARLQMESTQRLGKIRGDGNNDGNMDERLDKLADRLVNLLQTKRKEVSTYEGQVDVIEPQQLQDA